GHFLTMASRSCIDAGRPADAVAIAQRAVSVDRAVGGERSLHVARDLNDLGMALIAHGQLAEAAAALEESIQIYREEHEA
ncbi:tetratricopeptide repeat protein, partial [Rhizobium johnstonii]